MADLAASSTTLYTSVIPFLGYFTPSSGISYASQTYAPSPSIYPSSRPRDSDDDDDDDPSLWEGWSGGTRSGIVIGILLVVLGIVILSAWCCGCGCFKGRREKRNPPAPANTYAGGNVALRAVPNGGSPVPAQSQSQQHLTRQAQPQPGASDPDAPPPSYDAIRHDAIVPPSEHHRVGAPGAGEDEEFNAVADGKTPLSEIPFEDVDINALREPSSAGSSSASRTFGERHHWGGGDTTGHTNS